MESYGKGNHPAKALSDSTVHPMPRTNGPNSAFLPTGGKPATDHQQTVTGSIKSSSGREIVGATVRLVRTGSVVRSDEKGQFRIQAAANDQLEITYIGFNKVSVSINGRQTLDIVMEESAEAIATVDVVSTGYQNLDRKLFTGASTKINAREVERFGVPDASRMLEGQVAGVSVQNVSGTFGAAPKIRVRGATSLTGDNKPLWVIDGVILDDLVNISNEALSTGDPNTLLGSSVAGLNPDDIESFQVLKDAAATAMYGAAAMNGVVLVTTKRGSNTDGSLQINYSGNYSTYIKPHYGQFDIMNSADQMQLLLDMESMGYLDHARVSRANTSGVFGKMYNLLYDYNTETQQFALRNSPEARFAFLQRYSQANTDWFDLLFRSGLTSDHSLSVITGTQKSQTYVSTSFMNDQGFTIGNQAKRFTGNLRNNFTISDKLSGEIIFNGMIRDQQTPGTLARQSDPVFGSYDRDFDINPYSYALNTSRIITPYHEDGSREYFTREFAPFNIFNELDNNYMHIKQMDLKVQGGIRYKLIPELTLSLNGMYRYTNNENQHFIKENSNAAMAYRANPDWVVNQTNRFLYHDPDLPNEPRFVTLPNGGFFNTTADNMVSFYVRGNAEYDRQIGDHSFNAFGTVEVRQSDRQDHHSTGPGIEFANGNLILGDYRFYKKLVESSSAGFGMWQSFDRYIGVAFRGAYNFKDKYSLNFTTRYDGSNRLGKSTIGRWLPTWNISGAWDMDRESFFESWQTNVLSSVRLRGTYGLVGNIGNGANAIAVFMNEPTLRPYAEEIEGRISLDGLTNRELTWEKMYELNVGLDVGFWDNRVDFHVDWYRRNNFDLIGLVRTSGIGGQFQKVANYADMKGHGVDAEIGGYPINNDNFNWRTSLTYGFNKTRVTKLDINANIWELIRPEGGAMLEGPHRGLYSLNFEKLDEERGYPMFTGADGTPGTTYFWLQSNDVDFLKYHGQVDPIHVGGWFNRFQYGNFSASFLLKFSFGNFIRLAPSYDAIYSDLYNVPKDMINRWVFRGDERLVVIPSIIDPYTADFQVKNLNGEVNNPQYTYNAYNYSSERVAKGDYIRLSQVTLGYSLPQKWLQAIKLRTGSVNLVANNLFLLYSDAKLNGVDPEFYNNGGVALPIPKQMTFSLKLGF